ncbi:MAG TPA: DNA cytosine methyltransferase [Micromonosporaceae bacterium]|nr:DNA cytosine methyltransferase [Micromonosporaceae bacterium]
MGRPRLLDLYCGAGGAARGYQLAGWHVTGVDSQPQPRYAGDVFIQADALTVPLDGYDAAHASPPCHDHTSLTSIAGTDGTGWLLAATRERLAASGLPWIIENVPGAPMRCDVLLCGAMFRLRTQRHRWFELSDPMFPPTPEHPRHRVRTVTRARRRAWAAGLNVSVTGDVGSYVGPEALGIDWMTGNELSQAIPPAYTRLLGEHLLTKRPVTT